MPATVTLVTTTLADAVGPSDTRVKLASTSGVLPGMRLYVDGELMAVFLLAVDPWVEVRRGVDGTASAAHPSSVTVYIGRADQFYSQDPTGRPNAAIPVSPYINATSGRIWFAQGDANATADRWWQLQTTTHGIGSLGIRTVALSPDTST